MADRGIGSVFERRVRLQVVRAIAMGMLDGSGLRGRCLTPECGGNVWGEGVKYCRACWLVVTQSVGRVDEQG